MYTATQLTIVNQSKLYKKACLAFFGNVKEVTI